MESPFELPVYPIEFSKRVVIIRDQESTDVLSVPKKYADYVVQAINCHEKLVEAIDTFPDVHMCTCNCEVCLWFRTKARPVRQALKEEEKPI